jgi:hypothetical protein
VLGQIFELTAAVYGRARGDGVRFERGRAGGYRLTSVRALHQSGLDASAMVVRGLKHIQDLTGIVILFEVSTICLFDFP